MTKRLKRIHAGLISSAMVAGILGACGGSSDGGIGRVSSGLPPNRPVTDLTAGEVRRLCEAIESTFEAHMQPHLDRMSCVLQAAFSPGVIDMDGEIDVAACERELNACLESGPSGSYDDLDVGMEFSGGVDECVQDFEDTDLSDCDATVAEVEDCLNASLARFPEMASALSCSAMSDPEAFDMGDDFDSLPPACEALERKCPELVDYDDDDDWDDWDDDDWDDDWDDFDR